MNIHLTKIAVFLFVVMSSATTYSATPIEIGMINSDLDGAICSYYRTNDEKPKLVKVVLDKGPDAIFKYEHPSGNPSLLLGSTRSGQEWKRVAAININGKELLLDLVKQEPSQCLDEVHQMQIECSTDEFANHEYKIIVKKLTAQSACFPDGKYCAGDAASVLIRVESQSSKTSIVAVGGCGE